MAAKKACVIHTEAKRSDAENVAGRLASDGYEVCITEVSADEAKAVQSGDSSSLTAEVRACIDGADLCVILVDDDADICAGLGGIAGAASDGGCRVITVGGEPEEVPEPLDDIIDGHVPAADSADLLDIANGRSDRVKSDRQSAAKRSEDKVKCQ